VRQAFNEEIWRRVVHPEENSGLDEIFAIASPFLAAPAAQNPASVGLRRRGQIDVAHDDSLPVRALVHLSKAMALPLPDLFRIEGETGQTTLLNVQHRGGPRPVLLLGPPTLRRNSFDLLYDLATYLAFLRPERFPRVALRTPGLLRVSLDALRALVTSTSTSAPARPVSGEAEQLKIYLQRTMPPAILARLAEAIRKLPEGRDSDAELGKWIAATDLTAARVALVLTGELAAAFRVISSEQVPLSPVPARRRMADLVAFSVSDDYFACRRQLGLALEPERVPAVQRATQPKRATT
jgi:hypothetical protein